MITFGYKKTIESILRAVIAIVLGVVLFLYKSEGADLFIRVIGIGILFAALVSLLPMLSKKKEGQPKGSKIGFLIGATTCSIAAIIGLTAALWPHFYSSFFVFLVALSIIVFCAIQLIAILSTISLTGFKPLPMILTAVALIGAIVVMFLQPGKVVYITTGMLLIVYGVAEVISLFRVRKAEEIYIIRYGAAKEAEEARSTAAGDTLLVTGSVKEVKPEEE